ncbi:MAG: hypothetical protein ACUZ8E_10245 [Candidatus Anammoxibacter sp.]
MKVALTVCLCVAVVEYMLVCSIVVEVEPDWFCIIEDITFTEVINICQ